MNALGKCAAKKRLAHLLTKKANARNEALVKALKEFLAKGGRIEHLPPGKPPLSLNFKRTPKGGRTPPKLPSDRQFLETGHIGAST